MKSLKKAINLISLLCLFLLIGCQGKINVTGSKLFGLSAPLFPLSGLLSLGPVEDATITCWTVDSDGNKLDKCGEGISVKGGGFEIEVIHPEGPFILEASGGRYLDEGTATFVSIDPGEEVSVLFKDLEEAQSFIERSVEGEDAGIGISPITTIQHKVAVKDMTDNGTAIDTAITNAASVMSPIINYMYAALGSAEMSNLSASDIRLAPSTVYDLTIGYQYPADPVAMYSPPVEGFPEDGKLRAKKKIMSSLVSSFSMLAAKTNITQATLVDQFVKDSNDGTLDGKEFGVGLTVLDKSGDPKTLPDPKNALYLSTCYYSQTQATLKSIYEADSVAFYKVKKNARYALYTLFDLILPKANALSPPPEEPIALVEEPLAVEPQVEVAMMAYETYDFKTGETIVVGTMQDPYFEATADELKCGVIQDDGSLVVAPSYTN